MDKLKKNKITDDIVISFQQGDEQAFNEIYNHYHRQIYFIAYEILNNVEASNDIVQETFMCIYNKKETLKSPKAFNIWIKKIAYNLCIQQIRKSSRVSYQDEEETLDTYKYFNDKNEMYDDVDNVFLKEEIFKAVDGLSPKLKIVFLLRYYEGFSAKETADILDVSVININVRLKRAREALQKTLVENDVTPEIVRSYTIAPVLISASLFMKEASIFMDDDTSKHILAGITAVGTTTILGGTMFKGTLIALVTVSVTTGGLVAYNNSKANDHSSDTPAVARLNVDPLESAAKIKDIVYSKEWTNKLVNVDVSTSTINYDNILINDVNTSQIVKNGTYTIKLVKGNKTIDSRSITVTNIDKTKPVFEKLTNKGRIYTIHLSDTLSGLDLNSTVYKKNGKENTSFTHTDNTITFKMEKNSKNDFYVFDKAGNKRHVWANSTIKK